MVKNKNTPTQRHKITTLFGLSLFTLVVLLYLFSTAIPMASTMFQYPNARHFNISVMIIVFAIATIMPALVAYFIGDSTTRSKKDTLHHYNGVLLGFLAHWLVIGASWLSFTGLFGVTDKGLAAMLVTANIPPVIISLGVVMILAIFFAKKQKSNASILQFLPYQITLLVSVAGAIAVPYVLPSSPINPSGAIFLIVPVVITALLYVILKKQNLSKLARITDALIAMSIGWVAITCVGTLISFTRLPYQASDIISYAAGIIVLATYLYLRVRK